MSRQNSRIANSGKSRKQVSNADRNIRRAMRVVDSIGPRIAVTEGEQERTLSTGIYTSNLEI